MIRSLSILAVLCSFSPPDDKTLLTWDGRKYTGTITPRRERYHVRTLGGTHEILKQDVAIIFGKPPEIIERAESDFRDAKALYNDAKDLDERNPIRNEKLLLAVTKGQNASKLYRLAEPFYAKTAPAGFGRKIQTILQFLRLCRGSVSSSRAGTPSGKDPQVLALADPHFAYEPPETAKAAWVYTEPFGPGQASLAEALSHPDAEKRRDAVAMLTHPPAPQHLPDLMRVLESETDADVIGAMAEGLDLFETAPYLKSLGWAKQEADARKRGIAFSIARKAGTSEAFEFLSDWFVASPPSTNQDRAAFASAFRAYRDKSGSRLKELLTRHRSRRIQAEILMQMGLLRDTDLVGMLINAIPSYPDEAAASLTKIGKPAVPYILRGFSSSNQTIRKQCMAVCRRITGVKRINAANFEKWWASNRRDVLAEEEQWWVDQEAAGFPVDSAEFRSFKSGRKKG